MPDHEYPPADWTVRGIASSLREADREFPVPEYAAAEEWRALREDGLTAPLVEAIESRAEGLLGGEVPPIPASHYLRWVREDGITQPEIRAPLSDRLAGLTTLTLAECFGREGQYTDSILDHVWALCEQTTWAQNTEVLSEGRDIEGLPAPVDSVPPSERKIALRQVKVARLLAEVDYVLGEKLHPAPRRRIRHEVERRIFETYEARDDLWWMTSGNNWNAAVNGQTLVAALYLLDDPERTARIAEAAAASMQHYIEGFDAEGSTPEGIGYWNFGVGNYVTAAANLEVRTGGEHSLFTPPVVEKIATLPLRIEMSPGRFPPFSDSLERNSIGPYIAAFLGDRFGIEGLGARGRNELEGQGQSVGDRLGSAVRNLFWCRRIPSAWERQPPDPREYFPGTEWWIARDTPEEADGLTVAGKGGDNDEPHNHNDAGSLVVHYRGESLLTDLGKPHQGYPSDYWTPGQTYINCRSLGHSVPYINGCEQAEGAEFSPTVLGVIEEEQREQFELDLAGCYPEPAGVTSLRRVLTLKRGSPGKVILEDQIEFADADRDNEAESVLVSYRPISETDDGITVDGESATARIGVDAPVEIEVLDSPVTPSEVFRARFQMDVEEAAASIRFDVGVTDK